MYCKIEFRCFIHGHLEGYYGTFMTNIGHRLLFCEKQFASFVLIFYGIPDATYDWIHIIYKSRKR